MQILTLPRKQVDFKDYIQRRAAEDDCSLTITEPTTIYDDEGNLIAIYAMANTDTTKVVESVQRIKYDVNVRTGGLKTTSRIFGYRPRNVIRNDFCSITKLAMDSPKEYRIIADLAVKLSERYKTLAPDVAKKHEKLMGEKIEEEYTIPGSIFTSGIINKNNPLKYHFDTGNFDKVFSCMLVLRKNVDGGYLCLPEFDAKFLLKHDSLFLFDGQGILHGVTPMKIGENGFRYSMVFYSLKGLWNCLTIDAEVARIRNLKTERELKRRHGHQIEVRKKKK